jgi:hypothetical protein
MKNERKMKEKSKMNWQTKAKLWMKIYQSKTINENMAKSYGMTKSTNHH